MNENRNRQECNGRWLWASLALAALVLGTGVLVHAQQAPAAEKAAPSIHQLYEEDQKDRMTPDIDWSKVSVRDAERRKLARQILEAGALKTGQDFQDAAFIFQHSDTPQDYLLAHILAMAAIEKGNAKMARWIAAATLDRYLHAVKQPQVFGTQYNAKDPKANPPVYVQAPYDKDLLSDTLRREFCVTTYSGQQQNLEALNQGKDWPSPDSCPK